MFCGFWGKGQGHAGILEGQQCVGLYIFSAETDRSAVVTLEWEKVRIPFTVTVDLKRTQDAYRYAFNSGEFYEYWQNMQQAAEFCLNNDVFRTLSTYAGLLDKVGRHRESDSVLKIALPKGNVEDIFGYGSW